MGENGEIKKEGQLGTRRYGVGGVNKRRGNRRVFGNNQLTAYSSRLEEFYLSYLMLHMMSPP